PRRHCRADALTPRPTCRPRGRVSKTGRLMPDEARCMRGGSARVLLSRRVPTSADQLAQPQPVAAGVEPISLLALVHLVHNVRVRDYFIAAGARLAVAVAGRDVVRMLARELARIESPSHLVGETLHTFPRRSPLARHAHRPTASTSSWLS